MRSATPTPVVIAQFPLGAGEAAGLADGAALAGAPEAPGAGDACEAVEVGGDGLRDVRVRVDLDDLAPLELDVGDVRRGLAQVHEAEVVVRLDVLRVDRERPAATASRRRPRRRG